MMVRCALLTCLLLAVASHATAQGRPKEALDFSGGWAGFVDDATIHEAAVGGAVRFYVTPRLSVGPEVVYMFGPDTERNLFLTGNVTFDLLAPQSPAPPAVTPYLVGGGGVFRFSEQIGTKPFHSWEGTFTGGGGARFRVSDRMSVAGEMRFGWELHLRATAVVAILLGR